MNFIKLTKLEDVFGTSPNLEKVVRTKTVHREIYVCDNYIKVVSPQGSCCDLELLSGEHILVTESAEKIFSLLNEGTIKEYSNLAERLGWNEVRET